MREGYGNQFQSIFLALVVVLLTLAFASQFGGMQAQGCAADVRPAVAVGSDTYTTGAFEAVLRFGYGGSDPATLQASDGRKHAANGIVERALLAREAARLGMTVDPEDAVTYVLRTSQVYNTISIDASPMQRVNPRRWPLREADIDADELRARYEDLLGRLRRSPDDFAGWQAEEMMAERMRDLIRASVTVAPGEVWDRYVAEHDKATYRYVRYRASYFADRLDPTPAELDAYVAAHAQQMTDAYTAAQSRFRGLEEQVRARHVLIKLPEGADDAAKAATRARAEALLAEARAADSRGFAALARRYSEDAGSARKGGDLGWNARGVMVPPFDEAQFGLQPGQTSAVVETDFGFHIIRVEGRRRGDVPEAEAKRELAEPLYRVEKGREEAERAATALLARLRAGTTMDAIATELSPPPPEGADAAAAPPEDETAPKVVTANEVGATEAPEYGWSEGLSVTQAAFGLANEGDLVAAPVRAGDDFVVLVLDHRHRPVREEFDDAERTRLVEQLRTSKQEEAVAVYTRSLRERAVRAERVDIDPSVLAYPEPATGSTPARRTP